MEIHISRDGKTVGKFEEEAVLDGLRTGFLKPSDFFFIQGMDDWQQLGTRFSMPSVTSVPDASTDQPEYGVESTFVSSSAPINNGPVGIGGWLLFYCIGMTILLPLSLFTLPYGHQFEIEELTARLVRDGYEPAEIEDYINDPTGYSPIPEIDNVLSWIVLDYVFYVPLTIYAFIIGCMLWARHRKGKMLATVNIIVDGGVSILYGIIMESLEISGGLMVIVFSAGWSVLWWSYFQKSVRVRNTFPS